MSTARSADENATAAEVAAALRDAPFVRIVARADGDSLAASGILARALRSVGVPFHVRASPDLASIPVAPDGDGIDVRVGHGGLVAPDGGAVPGGDADFVVSAASGPATLAGFEIARELGDDPDPVLGLAGVVAAESTVEADGSAPLLDAAEVRDRVSRRPGVAVPTADLADGVAHTTLVHTPLSGDVERVRAALAELELPADLGEAAHRRVASLVAIEATAVEDATPRAAEAVGRALRPYATPGGPFETVGGYADVLDAVARERPGTGVALALGHGDCGAPSGAAAVDARTRLRTAALDAWREHARNAHAALAEATTGRYDGVFVARPGSETPPGALPTVARLLRDFRSPEPVALVVADGFAAAASVEPIDLGSVMTAAVAALDGSGGEADATDGPPRGGAGAGYGTATRGGARFDGTAEAFVSAFRGALP
ncbi:exonuclease RecJ [Halegenticoccus soli]|uniref:exonuclease RecJ n=1 Tax=Halegenticoccus soli TaxID=1985678 RepID=UPI000C6EC5A2|nr:exonuclease RecJ [Halegenticoccus soli]